MNSIVWPRIFGSAKTEDREAINDVTMEVVMILQCTFCGIHHTVQQNLSLNGISYM